MAADVFLTVASDLLAKIPTPPCLPVRSLYITDPIYQQNPLDRCPCLQIVHSIISQHLTTHTTLSTQPGVISMFLFLLALTHTLHLPKSHAPLRMCFHWVLFLNFYCLRGFVLDFCFSDFLFFGRDLWVILVFGILCLFVVHFANFSRFSPFSRNSRFGCLCSVLPARARRRHLQLARGSVYSG